MSDFLAVALGIVIGVLASVPIALVIVASTQPRKIERSARRSASVQCINAEIVTDERIAISKDDYLASIKALGDGMASPDLTRGALVAQAEADKARER